MPPIISSIGIKQKEETRMQLRNYSISENSAPGLRRFSLLPGWSQLSTGILEVEDTDPDGKPALLSQKHSYGMLMHTQVIMIQTTGHHSCDQWAFCKSTAAVKISWQEPRPDSLITFPMPFNGLAYGRSSESIG